MSEIWKDVIGFEGYYQVSNLGNIKGRRKGNLKTFINQFGYKTITLQKCDEGFKKTFLLHRLIAEAFIGGSSDEMVVNHIDGDKLNNNSSNLEWCTYKENTAHAINVIGVMDNSGEKNFNAKLSKEDILNIRKLYIPYSKEYGRKQLSEMYGVTPKTIGRIIRRELWKNV